MLTALALLSAPAIAGARDITPTEDDLPGPTLARLPVVVAQVGVSGARDPRVQLTGGTPRGITWMMSGQAITRGHDDVRLFPAYDEPFHDALAFRVGGWARHPVTPRLTMAGGIAFEPISTVGGVVVGVQNAFRPVVDLGVAPDVWDYRGAEWSLLYNTEISLGAELTPSPTNLLSVWAGCHVSGSGMWTDGGSWAQPRPEPYADGPDLWEPGRFVMELLQPSVAVALRL